MTTTIAAPTAPRNVRGYAPTGHRPNAVRDAEIYRRVFVLEELTQAEAAAQHSISAGRVSAILTEQHCRVNSARAILGLPTEKRPYGPCVRPNAARDAEIYRRVFELREISILEAAAEYELSYARVSEILTEEHERRHHDRRSRVPRQRPNQERDLEIYHRVVVRRELTPAQAAREHGISRQRIAQLLDKQHLQLHGVPRTHRPNC